MTEYFEKQYAVLDDSRSKFGLATMGPMSSFTWNDDPKRLCFVLSRYKFVGKVLADCGNALEVGCGDGFGARIVNQFVTDLSLSDVDPNMLIAAKNNSSPAGSIKFIQHDFNSGTIPNSIFDGIYLLDVLEHIRPESEIIFLENIKSCLRPGGKIVIGMPSIESQQYASPASLAGHVNCKRQEDLHRLTRDIFGTALAFSMNDETIHTGFSRMANYLLSIGIRTR